MRPGGGERIKKAFIHRVGLFTPEGGRGGGKRSLAKNGLSVTPHSGRGKGGGGAKKEGRHVGYT